MKFWQLLEVQQQRQYTHQSDRANYRHASPFGGAGGGAYRRKMSSKIGCSIFHLPCAIFTAGHRDMFR